MPEEKIKIMLSSSVHFFKTEIEQIYATLTGYGYEVLCSHMGTIYSIPNKSPKQSCEAAVEDCDFFFGLILPHYGTSGITHTEFQKAVEIDKPRGFLAHENVSFARQLLKQFMYDENKVRTDFKLLKKTPVMDDLRVIDMYNDAVGDGLPLDKRLWAQHFYNYHKDAARFVAAQFEDMERLRADLKQINK